MTKQEILQLLSDRVQYPISMEIAGPFAMFSRPDTGSEKTSYPVPTFSATKGIFESILLMPSVTIVPMRVQICSPVRYYPYSFNYRGELRKTNLIKDGNTCQIKSNILTDVCYRIYAYVINTDNHILSKAASKYNGINHAHSYQSQFNRYIVKSKNQNSPYLGLSEFLTSYVGVFRESTKVQKKLNFTIPSMLLCCYDSLNRGKWSPSSIQNVKVVNGELYYVK